MPSAAAGEELELTQRDKTPGLTTVEGRAIEDANQPSDLASPKKSLSFKLAFTGLASTLFVFHLDATCLSIALPVSLEPPNLLSAAPNADLHRPSLASCRAQRSSPSGPTSYTLSAALFRSQSEPASPRPLAENTLSMSPLPSLPPAPLSSLWRETCASSWQDGFCRASAAEALTSSFQSSSRR
jgi:hypothetical protein